MTLSTKKINKLYKVVVFCPIKYEKTIIKVIESFEWGRVENYTGWSFVSRGVTRVKALPGAHPTIGQVGKVEIIKESRIETICYKSELKQLIAAIKKVHPYEVPAIDVVEIIT